MNQEKLYEKQAADDAFVMNHLAKKKSYTLDAIEEAVLALHVSRRGSVAARKDGDVVKLVNQKNKQKKDDGIMSSNISDLDFSVKSEGKKIAMNMRQMMESSRTEKDKVLMLNRDTNPLEATQFDDLILLDKDINNIRPHIKLLNEASSMEVPTIAIAGDEVITGADVTVQGDAIRLAGVKDMVKAEVSDSLMELSTLDISDAVEDLLRLKMGNQELQYLFGSKISPANRDYNVFSATNDVTVLSNTSVIDGIDAALKDMDRYYKMDAKVVMTRAQYKAMVLEFANLGLSSTAAAPERYLGVKEIIINDDAPNIIVGKLDSGIVGNLSTSDFAVKKDAAAGIYKIALSYMADYKIVKEALRILTVA